jgi:hypothetical protein
MTFHLACIVEGHGEVDALPILVRRIIGDIAPGVAIRIPHPVRVPRSRLIKQGELERAVELAARQVGPEGGVLLLLDSDDDCPAELGPALLARSRAARGDMRISVVLAKREFESWFLAAAESLGLERPEDPEAIRGAKEWLSARMPRRYVETLDQPALAAVVDIHLARRSPSFGRFCREVSRLLGLE